MLAATVWTRTSDGSAGWVLPGGCLDVLWDGRELRVAGPDTRAEQVRSAPGTSERRLRSYESPGSGANRSTPVPSGSRSEA